MTQQLQQTELTTSPTYTTRDEDITRMLEQGTYINVLLLVYSVANMD